MITQEFVELLKVLRTITQIHSACDGNYEHASFRTLKLLEPFSVLIHMTEHPDLVPVEVGEQAYMVPAAVAWHINALRSEMGRQGAFAVSYYNAQKEAESERDNLRAELAALKKATP